MAKKTSKTNDQPPGHKNIESGGLDELRGLIEAFKAITFKAANHEEMRRDPIDWSSVQQLCERADMVVMDLQHDEKATTTGGVR